MGESPGISDITGIDGLGLDIGVRACEVLLLLLMSDASCSNAPIST